MTDDASLTEYTIGRHPKIVLLGLVGQRARELEPPWMYDVEPQVRERDQPRNRAMASLTAAIVQKAAENGALTADLILMDAANQAVAAHSWGQRRDALVDVAAQALNWRLAGDRRFGVPRMHPRVPEARY